jgi:hypothetical protein
MSENVIVLPGSYVTPQGRPDNTNIVELLELLLEQAR